MDRNRIVKRVFATLDSELKARPRGTKSLTEKAVGVREGYLRKMRSKGRISLNQIAAFLEVLEIDPDVFFRSAFPASSAEPALAGPLMRFSKQAAAMNGRFEKRAAVRHARAMIAEAGPVDGTKVYSRHDDAIKAIDSLRYADAARAAKFAEQALAKAKQPVLAARLLSAWASALRLLERLDEAMVIHGYAIQLACRLHCRRLTAELAERGVGLLSDRGDYAFGIEFADYALALYAELQVSDGVGRSLVRRGVVLGQMGQLTESIASYAAALKHLAQDNAPFLCAAHQGLGVVQLRVGLLSEADRSLKQALHHAPEADSYFCGRVAWLRARIAFARGQLDQAEQYFDEALASISERSPIDTVLVSAERVRLLLKMGRIAEARGFARDMTKLLLPIDNRPAARAALTDLIRAGMQGDALSVALVDRAIQALKHDAASGPAAKKKR